MSKWCFYIQFSDFFFSLLRFNITLSSEEGHSFKHSKFRSISEVNEQQEMAYSLPELPPPLSCISIVAIIIVYLFICYLVIDLMVRYENRSGDSGRSGLSREELQDITCFYNHKLGYESTCAICLDNLRNAQVCRAFPACNHVFHAQCIDPWLAKHLTCPTCRAPFEVKPRFCS